MTKGQIYVKEQPVGPLRDSDEIKIMDSTDLDKRTSGFLDRVTTMDLQTSPTPFKKMRQVKASASQTLSEAKPVGNRNLYDTEGDCEQNTLKLETVQRELQSQIEFAMMNRPSRLHESSNSTLFDQRKKSAALTRSTFDGLKQKPPSKKSRNDAQSSDLHDLLLQGV